MSDLLSIGASGIKSYQTALSAISNNVSNAQTPGYTRRTVSLAENSVNGNTTTTTFNGVKTASVGRAGNDYLAGAARTAASEAGRTDVSETWLSAAETALDDSTTGVGQSATALFNAGDALAADPGSTSNRQAFLAAATQTATAFRTTASALADTSDNIATTAQTTVQTVNADLDALDKINAALARQSSGTSSQADLMDQRDRLLDDVASHVGITVTLAQNGTATVSLAGSGVSVSNGTRLAVSQSDDGTLAIQAVNNGKSQTVSGLGGELGGLVDSAAVVAGRRNALDSMAADFAAALNGWQAAGKDADGNSGGALFTGSTASTLTIATSDPDAVAAASPNGTANGNLLTLSGLRGAGGVEKRWSVMVTDQGQMVSAAKSANTAASSASDAAATARDDATGVDLDTEAAELLRYQQAYNGAAKVIQVAKETLDSILQLF